MIRHWITAIASAVTIGVSTAAQAQEQASCAEAAYRQLDFWVGEWDVSWTDEDGDGGGRNQITRGEYGDCVIYERFSAGDYRGMSVSTYHGPTGVWRQTWVDNSGSYFALTGGPSTLPGVRFELRNTRLSYAEPQFRMIWENVTESTMTWRWQSLPPEADPEQDDWQDSWVIQYRRRD